VVQLLRRLLLEIRPDDHDKQRDRRHAEEDVVEDLCASGPVPRGVARPISSAVHSPGGDLACASLARRRTGGGVRAGGVRGTKYW
jgi:hypothetical protein